VFSVPFVDEIVPEGSASQLLHGQINVFLRVFAIFDDFACGSTASRVVYSHSGGSGTRA
jgi:hypothetical protein